MTRRHRGRGAAMAPGRKHYFAVPDPGVQNPRPKGTLSPSATSFFHDSESSEGSLTQLSPTCGEE